MTQPTEPVEVTQAEMKIAESLVSWLGGSPRANSIEKTAQLFAAHRIAERERVLREEFEPWREKVKREALETSPLVKAAIQWAEIANQKGWLGHARAQLLYGRVRDFFPTVPDPQTGEK